MLKKQNTKRIRKAKYAGILCIEGGKPLAINGLNRIKIMYAVIIFFKEI